MPDQFRLRSDPEAIDAFRRAFLESGLIAPEALRELTDEEIHQAATEIMRQMAVVGRAYAKAIEAAVRAMAILGSQIGEQFGRVLVTIAADREQAEHLYRSAVLQAEAMRRERGRG